MSQARRSRAPSPPTVRPLSIANQHRGLRIDRAAVRRVIATLDAAAATAAGGAGARWPFRQGVPAGELSIVFMTDGALAQLHADFLDDPTPTDVITFEGRPELGAAGEICVSADRAADYARSASKDFSEELTLYLVHGWLHLAGYDDLQPALKRQMRAAEKRAMRCLAAAGVRPQFSLAPKRR